MAELHENIDQSPRDVAESLTEAEVTAMVERQPYGDDRDWQVTGLAYPTHNPVIYIKYGDNEYALRDSEARTHQYAYDALQRVPEQDRQGVRIPEIYRIIETENSTYIIMEYIRGRTLAKVMEDESVFVQTRFYYYDRIERALKLLLSFPVPKGAAPGPFGGGIIRHPLFKDYRAPIQYDSVDMLEKHLNKVSTTLNQDAPKVTLERDLHFVFADLYEGNFMFTDNGDVYVIDFEQASFLPLSFMTYAMVQMRAVAGALRNKLDLPEANVPAMRHICSWFVMSWTKLGLPL
ncbi:kinase-like domain-containing protein [Ilyonectria destructans]|nr:kinase-like domain-containing protein [Ilyonectria destructans]